MLRAVHADRAKGRGVTGYREMWHLLRRDGHDAAPGHFALLMPRAGLRGITRGRTLAHHRARCGRRRRTGRERKVTITLLSADGTGRPYTRPTGATRSDRYIRLNHRFWTEGWAQTLTLPAIAMLMVALHESPGFTLPTEHMPGWYGWSADTVERGMRELEGHGLLLIRKQIYTDPISPSGVSSRNVYTVLPPFDTASVDADAAAHAKARR